MFIKKLFAEYIGVKFIDAENVMEFNYDNIFCLFESCKYIFKTLYGIKCAVITGFYGATLKGKIKTFFSNFNLLLKHKKISEF